MITDFIESMKSLQQILKFSEAVFKKEIEKAEQKPTLAKTEPTGMHNEELDISLLLTYTYDFV